MTQPGLSQISPDLVEWLASAPVEKRTDVLEKSCRLAIEQAGLADKLILEASSRLGEHAEAKVDLSREVQSLTERLDERAWDIQDQVEAGKALTEDYERAFRQARASAAIGFALEGSLQSTFDALYEAYYAIGDRDLFMRTVAWR